MKASATLNLTAVTLEHSDLKLLVAALVEYLHSKKIKQISSTVSFIGNSYKEEYHSDTFPEFQNFKEGLKTIDINIKSPERIEISITLSSNEVNPLGPIFSKVLVESDDEIVTSGLLYKISAFFKRRSNFHIIFHTFGIPISLGLSYLVFAIVSYLGNDFIVRFNIDRKYLLTAILLLSFPIKEYLRWLFPYIYFVGESQKREVQKMIFYGVVGSLIASFIFLLFQGKIEGFWVKS